MNNGCKLPDAARVAEEKFTFSDDELKWAFEKFRRWLVDRELFKPDILDDYMLMYSTEYNIAFKNRNTRKYIIIPISEYSTKSTGIDKSGMLKKSVSDSGARGRFIIWLEARGFEKKNVDNFYYLGSIKYKKDGEDYLFFSNKYSGALITMRSTVEEIWMD